MDNYQVCALRHKRHIIASNVELDDDTITELTKQKLINKAMLDNLKGDVTNFCRMVRYLELLESGPTGISKGAFERLCGFLESLNKQWISDELRTELKTVRGELVIENYIRVEAQLLVTAQFGQIRRLSEMEKVDMQKVVAQRMQHYKEVWKRAIADTELKLAKMNEVVSEKMRQQNCLVDKLRQYVVVRDKLTRRASAADSETGKAASSGGDTDGDGGEDVDADVQQDALSLQITKLVSSLKSMTTGSVRDRQVARDEKQRALRVIGVDDVSRKLDIEVNRALDPVYQDLGDTQSALDRQLHRNNQLRDELTGIETERDRCLGVGDDTIAELHERLATAERLGRDLRAEMHRTQQRVIQTRNRVGKYKMKSTVMNNVRNLGYVSGALEVAKVDASDRMRSQRMSVFDIKSATPAPTPPSRQAIRSGLSPTGAR